MGSHFYTENKKKKHRRKQQQKNINREVVAKLYNVVVFMMKQKAHCTKDHENANYIPNCDTGLLSALEQVTS